MAAVSAPGHSLIRLDNGVRVVLAPMLERASATVSFMFGVGSRWETGRDAGLAHFIEHMVFKGGRDYPTARSVSEAVESVGGVLNAATDRESTVFWAKVPAARLDGAIDVLCDILMRPNLDPAEVAKERLVVLEEIRMYQDSPQDHVQTLFDEAMWPGHPLGTDVAGTEATVLEFDADACRRHMHSHYRPQSLVVSVAGAIDPDAVTDALASRLNGFKAGPAPAPFLPATPVTGDPLVMASRRTEQASIVIGARSASYLDDDRHAVDVLNCILGEGMSSRLFLELREQAALAYDVASYPMKLRDTGALCISLGCDPKRAPAAIRGAAAEIRKIATAGVTDTELRNSKEYTRGRLLVQLESTSARCNFYGQQELMSGTILEPDDAVAQVDAVTAADVARVASSLLDPAHGGLRAAVVGPFRSRERLEAALLDA